MENNNSNDKEGCAIGGLAIFLIIVIAGYLAYLLIRGGISILAAGGWRWLLVVGGLIIFSFIMMSLREK